MATATAKRESSKETSIYDAATFRPLDSLGRLIARTHQTLVDALEADLSPLGLTAAQGIVIIGLANGWASTAGEICRGMPYDPGSMTRLLDHLERMGYVTRERSTEDRRVVKVALTEEGRAVYPQIIQAGVDNLNRHLRGFSKQEAAQLEDFLRRILAND